MSSKFPEIPDALRALMAEIGPRWGTNPAAHVKIMVDRFSEVLKQSPKDGVTVRRGISYGPHPRQTFDLFKPDDKNARRAAVVFVHGGAFLDGHPNRTEEIYSNVLHYFARNGIVGLNIGYRLAGDAKYPGASEDIASVIKWVRAHADEVGIDASRIFLMGHSAGAAHAGSYAYDKRLQPPAGPGIAGFIVVSGRVRAETLPENPNAHKVAAYYETEDAARLDDISPVSHVSADSVPTFVAWGEYENPLIDLHCTELVYRLAVARRRSPPMFWMRGHNHTSTIGHINTAEDDLGRALLDFVANPR
ncbi:alpha/beta hydrolase [Bradyrhizobium erythrophlei]|jgi:acetyl esterase|uniref:Acetyl esterase/lipase n=1 Tax=Bradyrhizobium erythrophlei TaxID=1437360 RepID=A0A1M5GH87_9BRAD|nr:alpha/beta hydrolase [Bradyrhizobium erythrophlei]SHG03087.1 Acetyl esterase/lipase [Bradyrhizobium erythrophlei]